MPASRTPQPPIEIGSIDTSRTVGATICRTFVQDLAEHALLIHIAKLNSKGIFEVTQPACRVRERPVAQSNPSFESILEQHRRLIQIDADRNRQLCARDLPPKFQTLTEFDGKHQERTSSCFSRNS